MTYRTVNPANGELIKDYGFELPSDTERKLDMTWKAWHSWRNTEHEIRAGHLKNAARILRDRKKTFAEIITLEMGKPLSQAVAEIEKCALVCDFYADEAAHFLAPRHIKTEAYKSYVRYDSIGPVLAIMPWNYPFWQVFRFAAPALMAGNTGVLKHAPNVPQSALAIEEIFCEAGFPEGTFVNLFTDIPATEKVIEDSRIAAVTLTGSEAAGSRVASIAGKALKKTVLELGGSDPFIVLPDADLEHTVKSAVLARTINTGQSCIAAKRFIVAEEILGDFLERFRVSLEALKTGDPMKADTQIGPMARPDLRDDLHRQLNASLSEGADLLTGGKIPDSPGFFYPVSLLHVKDRNVTAFREETFGPLVTVTSFRTTEEAADIANNTIYGLGASVWTRDLERAERLAAHIESGSVFVNAVVKSDVRLPFGGIKKSGYGRELSEEGIREFTNIKTVYIAPPSG